MATIIGPYQIEKQLPGDGLGARYLASELETGKQVVLRFPAASLAGEPGLLASLRSAPERMQDFVHPGVALPRACGDFEGQPYFVSSYVQGITLAQRLAETAAPWPANEAVPVLSTLSGILDAAHARDLYHGHLSSSSIILRSDGEVIVVDWGLIWSPDPNSGMLLTLADLIGSHTLAPELLAGSAPPGPTGDRYALAAIAYLLFAGAWPFASDDNADLLLAQLTEDPADPRLFQSELTSDQAITLLKGLARDPDRRYPTAKALIAALENVFMQTWRQIGLRFATVPAGAFTYGEGEGVMRLDLPQFEMAIHPITVTQFAAFVDATGYITQAEQEGWGMAYTGTRWEQVAGASWRQPRGPDSDIEHKKVHPVVQVSHQDARAFCEWAGLELPDEEQWEKAARGDDARRYPWGDVWQPRHCHHAGSGRRDTVAVDLYQAGASPYGIHGLAGNIWEWTTSTYDPAGAYQVLRGGAWPHPDQYLTTTFRYYALPAYRSDALGFRCILPPTT